MEEKRGFNPKGLWPKATDGVPKLRFALPCYSLDRGEIVRNFDPGQLHAPLGMG